LAKKQCFNQLTLVSYNDPQRDDEQTSNWTELP